MIGCGIDAGSRAMKVVLMRAGDGRAIAAGHADQIPDQARLAEALFEETVRKAGLNPAEIGRIVGTGYGRQLLARADTTVTEITCQARGVRSLVPGVRSIIDIGGQDSKIIFLDGRGVRDFAMNDRCAAGTGRFLELVAARLETDLAASGAAAQASTAPTPISSTCVVFAETEIVGLLASRARPGDIAAGVQRAIAARIAAMAGRRVEPPVVFSGGVALVPGMAERLADALGCAVEVAADPQFAGALGAALVAAD